VLGGFGGDQLPIPTRYKILAKSRGSIYLWPYVGVSNFWGGDQFPIPTRYKISVWGGTSPPPHVKFPAWGGPVPPTPTCACNVKVLAWGGTSAPPCPRMVWSLLKWNQHFKNSFTFTSLTCEKKPRLLFNPSLLYRLFPMAYKTPDSLISIDESWPHRMSWILTSPGWLLSGMLTWTGSTLKIYKVVRINLQFIWKVIYPYLPER